MSEYITEIRAAFDYISIHGMPLPDGIVADDSWMSIRWGPVCIARSHGDPTWSVSKDGSSTEHTSLVHAILRAKALLA